MGWEMTLRKPLALLLVLLLPAVALGFWGKKTDEEKLKDALDSLKVHLYLAGKAAVTKTAGTEEAKAVKDRLLAVAAGATHTVQGLQGKEGAAPEGPKLSLKDVAGLGKALWDMRAVGKQLLEEDKDSLPPVLPVLLTPLGVEPELLALLDRPTDHAVLFVALTLVKLHPDSPVPIPPELILYEGSRMDPAQVKIPGFTSELYVLKAYTLAMSGMCDLAEKEALRLDALGLAPDPAQAAAGVKLLTGKELSLSPEQLGSVEAATQVLAQGSLALCFFGRGAWEKGQQALGRFLEAADRAGIDEPELHLLHAYVECSSKLPEKGKARLAALAKRKALSEDTRDDVESLQRACEQADAEGMQKIVGRARLGRVIVSVAWEDLKRSGLLDALGELPWVKAVRDFVTTLGQGIAKVPGALKVSLGGSGWD
ncbi:MAG: hypothetical protein ACJ8AT_26760 [Hyalangium sp.]|uniref:hypothetical protein n=1 Tax=Hyalangium sp. TaxID=2028555 RepID=UPI00389A9681